MLSLLAGMLTLQVCGVAREIVMEGTMPRYLLADDSMITLRVAHNLATGHGLYFNDGQRTAANTSLFWPVAVSAIFHVIHDAARAVLALSIVSSLLCAVAVSLVTYFAGGTLAALATAVTMLLLPGLAVYGNSIWEHVPQMLLVTLAWLLLLGRVRALAAYRNEAAVVLLSLAFLARPDTLPLMIPVLWLLLRSRSTPVHKGASILFLLLCLAAYYGLHHHLYGSFVPNTYNLKVRLGPHSIALGLRYLLRSSLDSVIPMVVLALGILCLSRHAAWSREERAILSSFALQAGYIVMVGGDVFANGRFLLVLAPVAVLLFWEHFFQAEAGGTERVRRFAFVALAVVVAGVLSAQLRSLLDRAHTQAQVFYSGSVGVASDAEANQVMLVDFLRERIRPSDGEIGVFYLGSLPYYLPEFRFADFLGKADPVIAVEPVKWGPVGHNKWDFEHSLRDRHVSVIPFQLIPEKTAALAVAQRVDFGFFAALELDPYLRAHYKYRSATELGSPGTTGLFIRNDLLARFSQNIATEPTR